MKFETDRRTRGEQRVLACLLQRNQSLLHCAGLIPRHFSHDQHGMIFAAIRVLIAQGVVADPQSVLAFLCDAWPRNHWSADYLHMLADLPVRPSNCGYYAMVMFEELP
ncbi:DnaB-like helicase N-terminal domain-containing protein [Paraburkholderia sp. MM5477-R1]|uniref:DnaB-like helicase N-terminal domain-containing protein n=1 Tax=Paraburkholderia sp. MM5477-R1 TaxID=2991062 RepID=UPI003D25956B